MTDSVLMQAAASVRLLALDSDGVLTDGGVYLFDDGREFRRFNIKDGLGLQRAMQAGIVVAIVSAAPAEIVLRRAAMLGVAYAAVGVKNKLDHLQGLWRELNINAAETAYMGDDLVDLPVLNAVGLPCAPADAVDAVKSASRFVSRQPGGYGAVRELCDLLIQARS
ncbi:MAG: HAD-IIIA family hydrolase [bacterium]|nr:HAD-IIIA family hydrolase [bacterium]